MKVNRIVRGVLLAISVLAIGALSLGTTILGVTGGGDFPARY